MLYSKVISELRTHFIIFFIAYDSISGERTVNFSGRVIKKFWGALREPNFYNGPDMNNQFM